MSSWSHNDWASDNHFSAIYVGLVDKVIIFLSVSVTWVIPNSGERAF